MDSYILYLNIILIFVLSLIITSTLISKKDDLKTRLSFCFFFLIVIINCSINLCVLYFGNHQLIYMLFSYASCGFLFGPMLLQYVYFLLNQKLPKWWKINYLLSLIFFFLGFYYLFIPEDIQKIYLQEMVAGINTELGILNLMILSHCFFYFIKVRLFLNTFKVEKKDIQLFTKKRWASDFVNYMILCNILILLCYIILTIYFVNSLVLGDLVVMPLIILSVYSFIMIKYAQQHKEAEFNFALSLVENQKKLQEQRLSIARDLHDNIGSQLTLIISSADNLKHTFEIENPHLDQKINVLTSYVQEAIYELRDTVWAMNHSEILFEDLVFRIKNYFEKVQVTKEQIGFSFQIHPQILDKKLPTFDAMNVFRIIQEALNNTLKHAQASMVVLSIEAFEDRTKIIITDNGMGFDNDQIESGNGLLNIQKRVQEIEGIFNLKSSKRGTSIEIIF